MTRTDSESSDTNKVQFKKRCYLVSPAPCCCVSAGGVAFGSSTGGILKDRAACIAACVAASRGKLNWATGARILRLAGTACGRVLWPAGRNAGGGIRALWPAAGCEIEGLEPAAGGGGRSCGRSTTERFSFGASGRTSVRAVTLHQRCGAVEMPLGAALW